MAGSLRVLAKAKCPNLLINLIPRHLSKKSCIDTLPLTPAQRKQFEDATKQTLFSKLRSECAMCSNDFERDDEVKIGILFDTNVDDKTIIPTRALFVCESCEQILHPIHFINTMMRCDENASRAIDVLAKVNSIEDSDASHAVQDVLNITVASLVLVDQIFGWSVAGVNGDAIDVNVDAGKMAVDLFGVKVGGKRRGEESEGANGQREGQSKKGKKRRNTQHEEK